jgi:hypothetical protein
VLDLSWLRGEVADLYSADKGRPGIDPEAALRLMLAGFLVGIVHDRRLMREAQVNLAIRWFTGYALHEVLPDHSSLTRIRQRWGVERFRQIFERTCKRASRLMLLASIPNSASCIQTKPIALRWPMTLWSPSVRSSIAGFSNGFNSMTFNKRDFYEDPQGKITIARPLTAHLAMTAPLWRSLAEPC